MCAKIYVYATNVYYIYTYIYICGVISIPRVESEKCITVSWLFIMHPSWLGRVIAVYVAL